jgi:uncharacterized low-complexity protein
MKKMTSSFAVTVSAALISSISTSSNANENLFSVTELSSGYMLLSAAEMECGANMNMDSSKTIEGSCAVKKSEGKCGSMMHGDKMKNGMEAMCGAMMKEKEGACGQMSDSPHKEDEKGNVSAQAVTPGYHPYKAP